MPLTSFFLYGLFLVHTLRLPLPPPPAPRSKDSSPPPPLPPGHANLPPKGGDAIITITKLKIALAATFTPPCHITRPSPTREINCKEQCRRGGPRPPPPGTASGPGCNGTRGKEDPAGEAATGRAGPTSLVVWPTGTPASISFNVCEVDKMQHFSLTHFFKIYSGLCPKIDPVIKCIFLCDY